jgi:PhzF family phenazine biosynthesis protein
MVAFTRWTNLSEATFVLPPTVPEADYRVRIFTSADASGTRGGAELPFAGHPTLGTCHAWLAAGGVPRDPALIVQECGAGLVSIRPSDGTLSFAAPPLLRYEPVDEELVQHIAAVLRIGREAIVDSSWIDNGPGWVGVLLGSAEEVLALEPGFVDLDLGVVGPHPAGRPEAFELRAFFPRQGATAEDPVTGSLNASAARWLLDTGRATSPYRARQGTRLGRSGRVHVSRADDGTIWVGGETRTIVTGDVDL